MPEDSASAFGETRTKRIYALTAAVMFFTAMCVWLIVDFDDATRIVGPKSKGPLVAVIDPVMLLVCAALLRRELRARKSAND